MATQQSTTPMIRRSDDTTNFDDFLAIALQERKRILLITVVVFALFSGLAFSMRDRYTATASFIPPSSGASASAALSGQIAQLSGLGGFLATKNSADLYLGILQSRTIQDKLVQQFNLISVYKVGNLTQAEKQLSEHTDLLESTKTSVVFISFTDHDPFRARNIASAYLQELQHMSVSLALTESSQRRLFYEQRLDQEKNALADAEIAMKRSQEKSGLIAPAGQTSSGIQAIAYLRAQIANRRVQMASLLQDETEENPEVVRLRSEIKNLESQVARMEKGNTTDPSIGISTAQVPGLELDYVRLAREVKYHETLFDIIARQYEVARLDEAHDAPLQILDQVRLPDQPSGPRRLFVMAGGLFCGLLLGLLNVAFRARFRISLVSPTSESRAQR